MKLQIFAVVGLLMAAVFLPTTVLLFFGLFPTLVVGVIDRSKRKTQALTVGAMNVAGCSPFMLELWSGGNDFNKSIEVLVDPQTIVVIYGAAVVGYLIDWAMTGIVAGVMLQKAKTRLKAIQKRQAELVERWGQEVKSDDMDDFMDEVEEENA